MDEEEKRKRLIDKYCWKPGDIQIIHDRKDDSKEHREKASVQNENGAIKDVWNEGGFTRVIFEKDATSSDIATVIKDKCKKLKDSEKNG